MVCQLTDTQKAIRIFAGWEETLIYSCLQNVMGKIYVTDLEIPKSACACVGDFAFLAGEPNRELVGYNYRRFVIMTPQNAVWSELITRCLPNAERHVRYATKKNTVFDRSRLEAFAKILPDGYSIRRIDSGLYDECLKVPGAVDFVSVFKGKSEFLEKGRGFVVLKNGQIVGGASSYTSYRDGIEIEVDVIESERRKHLATAVCAKLILSCLDDGLYPSWDAANPASLHLAEKLGYEFAHEYEVYYIIKNSLLKL